MNVSIVNKTMELADCRDQWFFDEKHGCWCLEDVIYTPVPKVPVFQRLSIYAPKALMNPDGTLVEKAKRTPVVFENNAAGYMQMPHSWLDGPRCHAQQYLEHGYVYVTCGCSGRESRNAEGKLVGKGPSTLVDLKTAIRFLRHNREALPGDFEKIISVGVSAGGAMSSLLGVTGDNEKFLPYLKGNGAFLDESDAIYAAQIYCPIVDLEHADQAYEWMFHADKTCEDSHAGPAETMTPFKEALSGLLAEKYIDYFNRLELRDPDSGEVLHMNADGRSGNGYDYLMKCFEASATKYLTLLEQGKLGVRYTADAYISGDYTFMAPAPKPPQNKDAHHAGPNAVLEETQKPKSLGEMMLRPPKGTSVPELKPLMVVHAGTDKREWLSWDGKKASIRDLDTYVLNHRRRMKPCTSFDTLGMNSGENQVFGTAESDFLHFSQTVAEAIAQLKNRFPEEYDRYYTAFIKAAEDEALAYRLHLFNPMDFIGTSERSTQAKHYRIRVGAKDADTATTISMSLALKLANHHCGTVDYAIVWDQPHCDADYPGEVCDWINSICK